jgi:hypothetical protein
MTHEKQLLNFEARMVANYIEEIYNFKIGKTLLAHLTPQTASQLIAERFSLTVTVAEICSACGRLM